MPSAPLAQPGLWQRAAGTQAARRPGGPARAFWVRDQVCAARAYDAAGAVPRKGPCEPAGKTVAAAIAGLEGGPDIGDPSSRGLRPP